MLRRGAYQNPLGLQILKKHGVNSNRTPNITVGGRGAHLISLDYPSANVASVWCTAITCSNIFGHISYFHYFVSCHHITIHILYISGLGNRADRIGHITPFPGDSWYIHHSAWCICKAAVYHWITNPLSYQTDMILPEKPHRSAGNVFYAACKLSVKKASCCRPQCNYWWYRNCALSSYLHHVWSLESCCSRCKTHILWWI